MYQYFVKIVPTTYTNLDGRITRSNQYSVTKHEKQVSTTIAAGDQGLPGVFVLYELSPLVVKYKEVRRYVLDELHFDQNRPFGHFRLRYIVGNIW